jgi:hypothetical protein
VYIKPDKCDILLHDLKVLTVVKTEK